MADLTPGDPQDGVSADVTPSAELEAEAPSPAAVEPEAPTPVAEVAEPAAPEPFTPAAPAAATPEATPAPAPETSEASLPQPEVESSTTLPALGAVAVEACNEEGGEWDLLVSKVRDWLASGQLQTLWQQAKTPLTLTLALVGLLLVLRVYSALLAALDSLPLVPGLLELVGVIWAVRVGLPKLIQRSQREQLLGNLQQRWQRFTGRG